MEKERRKKKKKTKKKEEKGGKRRKTKIHCLYSKAVGAGLHEYVSVSEGGWQVVAFDSIHPFIRAFI